MVDAFVSWIRGIEIRRLVREVDTVYRYVWEMGEALEDIWEHTHPGDGADKMFFWDGEKYVETEIMEKAKREMEVRHDATV